MLNQMLRISPRYLAWLFSLALLLRFLMIRSPRAPYRNPVRHSLSP